MSHLFWWLVIIVGAVAWIVGWTWLFTKFGGKNNA